MRAKVKAGRRAEYEKLTRQIVPSAEADGDGLHSYEVAWEGQGHNSGSYADHPLQGP